MQEPYLLVFEYLLRLHMSTPSITENPFPTGPVNQQQLVQDKARTRVVYRAPFASYSIVHLERAS